MWSHPNTCISCVWGHQFLSVSLCALVVTFEMSPLLTLFSSFNHRDRTAGRVTVKTDLNFPRADYKMMSLWRSFSLNVKTPLIKNLLHCRLRRHGRIQFHRQQCVRHSDWSRITMVHTNCHHRNQWRCTYQQRSAHLQCNISPSNGGVSIGNGDHQQVAPHEASRGNLFDRVRRVSRVRLSVRTERLRGPQSASLSSRGGMSWKIEDIIEYTSIPLTTNKRLG